MNGRLSEATLPRLPAGVARPAYDRSRLKPGILHIGPGAFHRAHQCVFTEDAMAATGGDWGVIGVSLRSPALRDALGPQDELYAVETLGGGVRVMGVLSQVLFAPESPAEVLAAFADPRIHVVSLTITEAGYGLAPDGTLDLASPDISHDLAAPRIPVSAIGWLARGLAERRQAGAGPITLLSCDNLAGNGAKLAAAVQAFAARYVPDLARWIEANAAFPSTMVDCIVPAADPAHCLRVVAALGVEDAASVQREAFAAWAIEDRFAGPRPAWERAGAEIVASVAGHERLKLHVLNAAHSALAYLGLARGFCFMRQAIADRELAAFADAMVNDEIAPALTGLGVASYWAKTRVRLANPALDHRLTQIAEDGSAKLAQRIFPILIANARAGRSSKRLAAVVRAWLAAAGEGRAKDPKAPRLGAWRVAGGQVSAALDDPLLFPEPFRAEPAVRDAMLEAPG